MHAHVERFLIVVLAMVIAGTCAQPVAAQDDPTREETSELPGLDDIDDFMEWELSLNEVIARQLTIDEMHKVATAASELIAKCETKLKEHRNTLNGWNNSPYMREAFPEYMPSDLMQMFEGEHVAAIDVVRAYIEMLAMLKLNIAEIAQNHAPNSEPTPDEAGNDERLNIRNQTATLYEIRQAVDHAIRSRVQALDLVVDGKLYHAYTPLRDRQNALLQEWHTAYEADIAEREAADDELSDDEKADLALETRAQHAAAEKEALAAFSTKVDQILGWLEQQYESFGDDLARWIAGCPLNMPPMPEHLHHSGTFFATTAGLLTGAPLEGGPMQPIDADIGAWFGIDTSTFFHVPQAEHTEHFSQTVYDHREDFEPYYFRDEQRKHSFIGSIFWIDDTAFPNLAVPKFRGGPATTPNEPEIAARRSPYPDTLRIKAPSIRGIRLFGKGIPSRETNDWSWLVPQRLCEQHQLHGRWIVMVVHGRHLFDLEGREPELTWADRHLRYVLLGASEYGEEAEWRRLYDEMGVGDEHIYRGQDVYIVAVMLGPQTWAGEYAFRIGDLRVDWTLPFSTNPATTRFVQDVTPRTEYEHTDTAFPGGAVYLEIHAAADVPASDKIPFQLLRADANGESQLVRFGPNLEDTVLWAMRVPTGTTQQGRVFRSKEIAFNVAGGSTADRVVVGVQPGQLIAARIMPHSYVLQDGPPAVARIAASPAAVGADWLTAVTQAAAIAGVQPPKPWDQLTREELNSIVRTPWDTVDSSTYVGIGGREVPIAVGDLAAMLMVRAEFIRQMEANIPKLKQLARQASQGPDAAHTARMLIRPDVERAGSPLGAMEVRYRRPRQVITDHFAPFSRVYDEAWLEQTFGGIKADAVAFQNSATVDLLTRYAAAAEQTLLDAKNVDPKDAEAMLRLTTIGMRPIAQRLKPMVMRRVTVNGQERYQVDDVARSYLGTIHRLGDEFVANEALVDQYNARIALVAAGVSMLTPATVLERAISAGVSALAFGATVTVELPEYLARKRDIDFAIGAYSVVGPERYAVASMREKPGWAILLELAGGSLDCAMALGRLATGARSMRVLEDAEIADALADAGIMSTLTRREKAYLAARIIELDAVRAAGTTLEAAQLRILQQAGRLLDAATAQPALANVPEIIVIERAVNERTAATLITTTTGDVLIPTARYQLEVPGVLRLTEHGDIGSIATRGVEATWRDMGSAFDQRLVGEVFSLLENQPWNGYLVGERAGVGSFLTVYELGTDGARVLKVSREPIESADLIARVRHCVELMGTDIPQLAVHEARVVDDVAIVVQQRIPEGAYMLERVIGRIGRGTEVTDTGTVIASRPAGPARVIGVAAKDATDVSTMTAKQTKAVCDLYQKFLDKGLVWYDGHLANIVFETEGTELIAKVLDQDFVWQWERGIWSGPVGRSMGPTLEDVYRCEERVIQNRLQSMLGAQLPERAEWMLRNGQHLYPDAEFFMFKMLEFHGYINYVRGVGFTDGAMKLTDVLDAMPNLRRRMNELVDPDLHNLVRPGRRGGWLWPNAGSMTPWHRHNELRWRIAA